MGTVRQLTQLFTANQAKILAINGFDFAFGGWIPPTIIGADGNIYPIIPIYASASTFTAVGDFRTVIQRGDKLKFLNTTQKYAVVLSVSYNAGTGLTTFTIFVNTDYTLANAAITELQLSRENPTDFPGGFNYTPTLGTQAGTFTTGITIFFAYFTVNLGVIDVGISYIGTQAVANSNYLTFTLPTLSKNFSAVQSAYCECNENAALLASRMEIQNNSNSVRVFTPTNAQFNGAGVSAVVSNFSFFWY